MTSSDFSSAAVSLNYPNKIIIWIKALRAPFFTATIVPVLVGSLAAWHKGGGFFWFRFWLVFFGALFIHAGTNLANDYFDHLSGCDSRNKNFSPFNGGSRVIQNGALSAEQILKAALVCFLSGALIGIYLNYALLGNIILLLGVIGVILGFFYSGMPFKFGYRGFGELAVAIGFGPLMIAGAYYAQRQALPAEVLLLSIPVGVLIALVVYINEFPDYLADKDSGKNTLVVLLGKKKAAGVYVFLLASAYIFVFFLLVYKFIPQSCSILFLTLPLAVSASLRLSKSYDNPLELLPANAKTILLHLLFGVLLSAGFILDKI